MSLFLPLPAQNRSDNPFDSVFGNTVASYKFYWFLALLDIAAEDKPRDVGLCEMAARMIAKAWPARAYFRLGFGSQDRLGLTIDELCEDNPDAWTPSGVHISAKALPEDVLQILVANFSSKGLRVLLRQLIQKVPYRFLMPWIRDTNDASMMRRSQSFENDCLYAIVYAQKDRALRLNPRYRAYLQGNAQVLRDYTYWNLAHYFHVRNPGVPGILEKMTSVPTRESLNEERRLWTRIMRAQGPVRCIYTGLDLQDFALDHFMPYRLVAHNELWNLIPALPQVNSSKSDGLPDLNHYLPDYAKTHQKALKTCLSASWGKPLVESYECLGEDPRAIVSAEPEALLETYKKLFVPLSQTGQKHGFVAWDYMPLRLE